MYFGVLLQIYMYFRTEPLQCPHKGTQRLMFLVIIYDRLHARDGHVFGVSTFREEGLLEGQNAEDECPSHACDLSYIITKNTRC